MLEQTRDFNKSIPCVTWIGDGHTRAPWINKSFPESPRIYRTIEMGVMLQMVKQGLGIEQMPCALCDPDADLYRIPATYVEPGWGLWLLSHVDLRTKARVRVFKNFLLEELKKQTSLLEGKQQ